MDGMKMERLECLLIGLKTSLPSLMSKGKLQSKAKRTNTFSAERSALWKA